MLIREQQVVHFPELTLCSGALRSFGRFHRVTMDWQGKVPEDKTDLPWVPRLELMQRRTACSAEGAFEIGELDDRYRRIFRSARGKWPVGNGKSWRFQED